MARGEVDVDMGPYFRHEALIYEGQEQFLAAAVPFLCAALATGEPALVAVRQANAELLRAELGPDRGRVGFVAIEEVGRNPARIVPFWRDFLVGQAGRPARGISEPVWPGREAAEIDECQRHEHLLNLAFPPGTHPSLLCSYDGLALPDEVLAGVFRSHRAVMRGDSREPSGSYRHEWDCYSGKLPRHRPMWREGNYLLIDFKDRGTIEEPLAGRLHPATDQRGGRGLWLANQLCDLVQIRSDTLGTTVRVQAGII